MPIEKGRSYSWPDLIKLLNAEKSEPVDTLHRRGVFLGFALNRWQNPKAPDEVIVGSGENRERYVDSYLRDNPAVPVFIRETPKDSQWQCAGFFQTYGHTAEATEKSKRVIPGVTPVIYKILFLEETQAS